MLNGKVLYVSKMVVAPDGKPTTITIEDKRQNTTATIEAVKQ